MLILMMVISILCCVLGVAMQFSPLFKEKRDANYDFDGIGCGVTVISATITALIIIVTIIVAVKVSSLSVIDEKIAIYEEENQKIESQMDALVQKYMDYESNTYSELKAESSITLITSFPELKADALVQQQLDKYTKNNDDIKKLKLNKVNGKISRWWLYFGK